MLSRRARVTDVDDDDGDGDTRRRPDATSSGAVQPLNTRLQQSMMAEMDRRRQDWEVEMERLQQDFFKARIAKPQPTHHTTSSNGNQVTLPGNGRDVTTQQQHLLPQAPEYVRDGDDVICRWTFDVTGYRPEEICVKVDGQKLNVTAEHSDVTDENNSTTKQLNKQLDIPNDVIEQAMTSYMTRDNLLVVQAPSMRRDAPSPRPSGVTSSAQIPRDQGSAENGLGDSVDCQFRPIELPPEVQTSGCDVADSRRRHIVQTDDGEEMLKIVVDLGRSDYRPADISIQLCPTKIIVRVQRDESFAGKNAVQRKYSREIEVPDTVYGPTLRAMLAQDGKLWIGASLTTNQNHRNVTSCILQFMPRFAERCNRITQLYALTDGSQQD